MTFKPIEYNPLELQAYLPSALCQDITEYEKDDSLGKEIDVLVVVKRTNQDERDNYIKKQIELTGSDAPTVIRSDINTNQYYKGLITKHTLSISNINENNSNGAIVLTQPTAIAKDPNQKRLFIGAGNEIQVIDERLIVMDTIRSKWFARLHTLEFDSTGKKILATSGSMDMLHVIKPNEHSLEWEYCIWDNFPSINTSNELMMRQSIEPLFEISETTIREVIPDGLGPHHSSVPLHVNSAIFGADDSILFTASKLGRLLRLNKVGTIDTILSGLGFPHYISNTTTGGYIVTDTLGEKTIFLNRKLEVVKAIDFSHLPCKKQGLESERWLQTTSQISEDVFCAVDSPRSSIHLFSPIAKKRRSIKYPENWAVQIVISDLKHE